MSTMGSKANVHDQTYAVVVFFGALGLEVEELYMQPFGFLNYTQLVGRGPCNNPFPGDKLLTEEWNLKLTEEGRERMKLNPLKTEDYLVIDTSERGGDGPDLDRKGFDNHSYCEYKNSIYDACAGPSVGNEDRKGYVDKNVDSATSLNAKRSGWGFPGKISDIETHISFGGHVKEVV